MVETGSEKAVLTAPVQQELTGNLSTPQIQYLIEGKPHERHALYNNFVLSAK